MAFSDREVACAYSAAAAAPSAKAMHEAALFKGKYTSHLPLLMIPAHIHVPHGTDDIIVLI